MRVDRYSGCLNLKTYTPYMYALTNSMSGKMKTVNKCSSQDRWNTVLLVSFEQCFSLNRPYREGYMVTCNVKSFTSVVSSLVLISEISLHSDILYNGEF